MDWMEDSLLQLMKSPVWSFHVHNFIDEKCLIFDDEEENKLPYMDIHNEYKKVIEDMVNEYVDDFGINYDQLHEACSSGLAVRHEDLFKYLLAMEDFLLFKSIMVERNIELNREAEANLVRQTSKKTGLTKHVPGQTSQTGYMLTQFSTGSVSKSEEEMVEEVLQRNINEQQMKEKDFEELLLQAMEESLRTHKQEKDAKESDKLEKGIGLLPQPLGIENTEKSQAVEEKIHEPLLEDPPPLERQFIPPLEEEGTTSVLKSAHSNTGTIATEWIIAAKQEAHMKPLVRKQRNDDTLAETIKDREIYLKKRRDMIVELKEEREKQLGLYKNRSK